MKPAAASSLDGRTFALLGVAVGLLAAALLPCVVSFSPQVHFDVDPRSAAGQAPITAVGPAMQAWLHFGIIMLAAAALAVHLWLGGGIRWVSTGLVLVGMAFVAWHMPARFDGMIRGGSWLAAAALALAALHLTEHEPVRRLVAAACVAILVPMTFDALGYVFIEHPQTVAMFRAQEADFLLARGWVEGSPQHLLYKRRLEFPDATGAFGLSNVFGSFVAAFSLAALVAAVMLRKHRLPLVLAAVSLLGGLASLYLTHSKGAMLSFILAMLIVPLTLSPWRRLTPVVAVMLLLVPLAAVGVRGGLGLPDDHTGERSLLFRYQYGRAAARIIADHSLTGVGPAGFKDAYLLAKDPFNPEDVTSAHSVFIDWIAMLGVGGVAWSAAMVLWLWAAGRRMNQEDELPASPRPSGLRSRETLSLLAVAVLIFGVQYVHEIPQMLPETAITWIVGVVAFVGIAAVLAAPNLDRHWSRFALGVAATALLIHSQIEMTFFQEASSWTAWFVVAAAPGKGRGKPSASTGRVIRVAWAMPVLFASVAVALAVFYAAPVQRHQQVMSRAAAMLRAMPTSPAAIGPLEAAAAVFPRDPVPVQWHAQLLLEHASVQSDANRRRAALEAAVQTLDAALARGCDDLSLHRMLAQTWRFRAETTAEAHAWTRAIAAMRNVIARNPYSLQDRLALADLWWITGHRGEALAEYERILKLHEQAYLDPFRQLAQADLSLVQERMRE